MACTILLADDEKDFADTLAERLELRGYTVQVVYNGDAAVQAVETAMPDVAVVDLSMPGMSGDVVTHVLRVRCPQVPVIMLTGHACITDAGTSPCAEAWACLTKPVSLKDLLALVEKALAGGSPYE